MLYSLKHEQLRGRRQYCIPLMAHINNRRFVCDDLVIDDES